MKPLPECFALEQQQNNMKYEHSASASLTSAGCLHTCPHRLTPTWTVSAGLDCAVLCWPECPPVFAASLLCFGVSASEPCLPPELLSSRLISSDLWGGREWGEARLYSYPGWITVPLNHLPSQCRPSSGVVRRRVLYISHTYLLIEMTMKCPYLIKYETTQMVFQYSSAADKKNKSNIAIKIPNEFEMFLLSNCMRAPEAVSCFFVTQQFMRSCAWCSNSSIFTTGPVPGWPCQVSCRMLEETKTPCKFGI